MKKRVFMSLVMAAALMMSACSAQKVDTTEQAATQEVSTETAEETTPVASTTEVTATEASADEYDSRETITFGLVAAQSGANKTIGQYVINGVNQAVEEINAAGGVLGKELVVVIEDEGESAQTAVNATNKLLSYPEVSGIIGSTGSSYCLAVSPDIKEKQIPYMAGGSSANIPLENNEYMWQNRMTDDQSGIIMAKSAVGKLGMKNPAIMYSTESFGTGLKDQTVAALKDIWGIEVAESNIYGFNADEKQFGPIFSQILNSDVDGIIAACHTNPASVIVMQAVDAGIELPCLGSNAFSSIVCRNSAKELADGWYSVTDWTAEGQTGRGKEFADAYMEKYQLESDLVAVSAYDQVYLLANACETAQSCAPAAINEALAQTKDFEGAMSTYTYHDTHCFSTNQALTLNENVKAVLVEKVTLE